MKNFLEKTRIWYRGLPDKKRYAEFVTAILSVPIMLSVMILNWKNLSQAQKTPANTPPPTQPAITVIAQIPTTIPAFSPPSPSNTPIQPTTPPTCSTELGPITILSPQDDEIFTQNHLCIKLSVPSSYCPHTWKYSLNGESWSDPTSESICLYNLSNGEYKLRLNVISEDNSSTVIQREFSIQGASNPTPLPTPSSTPSVTPEN